MYIKKQDRTSVAFIEALQEFQQAVIDGYRLPTENTANNWPTIQQLNTTFAYIGITLEKDGENGIKKEVEKVVEETAEPVVESEEEAATAEGEEPPILDALSKKIDLLEYAAANGIEVPKDLVQASAIKKYLKSL